MSTGIVHIGVGNFFRAHLAVYVDALLAKTPDLPWGICGIGMLPSDRPVYEGLRSQGWRYNLVVKHPDGNMERQTVGALRDMLLAPDDPWAAVERLSDPATKIVSLTITEGGYNIDSSTRKFDESTPAVLADAVPGAAPQTVFGVVVHALQRRRTAGIAPFAVVSCDNIEGNGDIAREAFVSFARMLDAELATWIEDSVAFPSSMVDRITPVTTDRDRALLLEQWDVTDLVPVTCERFMQWVLEDTFPQGRPAFEEVGVQLVTDVRPYELMKLRLLNASHQALAYFGILLGYEYVHDAAQDPDLVSLLRRYMDEEATPTLEPLPGIDLTSYKAMLLRRFANPAIGDTLARLAAFSTDRIPKWLLPVIRERGGSAPLSAGVVASWLRYTEVHPDKVVDQHWASRAPAELLQDATLFGDLVDDDAFLTDVARVLEDLRTVTPREALTRLLTAGPEER